MTTYVALLRGINVGGNNTISMKELADIFTDIGFFSVRTYINSGNVIFQSAETSRTKLEQIIEKKLAESMHYKGRVLVRSEQDIEQTVAHFPRIFSEPDWKHNSIFLGEPIDNPDILKAFILKDDIEQNSYFKGVLYWSAQKEFGTRSTMLKLSTRPEYQEMTVRSIGTVTKILELMKVRAS